jgi:ectoine hydroxylase-related dioxygenase (phytanoyl-CoA dioxygenase family)
VQSCEWSVACEHHCGTDALTATLPLHPWNGDFRWQTPRGPFRRVTVEQAAQFDELGFVVLEGMFEPARIARVTEELDGFELKVDAFLRTQADERVMIAESGAITFTTHLVAHSEIARTFATHDVFVDLCADLLGPDVDMYWDQAVYKKAEKPRHFPWHQDNGYTFIEPQQYLTCWVALTDAIIDNGCPWVAPGVHKLGTLAHEYVEPLGYECFSEPPSKVAAPVRAGGIVVFSSLTPHMTGANTTDDVRKSYILQYAHAGSEALRGDPNAGPPTHREPCNDPKRQFPILRSGVRVET